jgi:uncharacterized tellurite resistance protein B-like protein
VDFLRQIFGGETGADPRYLLVECMVDVMLADGDIGDAEVDALQRAVSENEFLQELTPSQLEEHITRAKKAALDVKHLSKRIERLAEKLPSRAYRLAAYALACQVAISDRLLSPEEKAYLERLKRAFMLDEATCQNILSAAQAKMGIEIAGDSFRESRELVPAFIDCMALVAAADGSTDATEIQAMRDLVSNHPDLAPSDNKNLEQLINQAVVTARGQNPELALAQIARTRLSRTHDQFWALVYMAYVTYADGRTDWRETTLLESARNAFGFTDEMLAHALRTARSLVKTRAA